MSSRTVSREEIAYHEAGHAVVAHLLTCPIVTISIQPDGTAAGRVVHGYPETSAVRTFIVKKGTFRRRTEAESRAEIERHRHTQEVKICLAGPIAEGMHRGDQLRRDYPFDVLNASDYSSEDFERALEAAESLTTNGVAYLARVIPSVWHVLERNRLKVEAIAGALLEKETLSGADLDTILARRRPVRGTGTS